MTQHFGQVNLLLLALVLGDLVGPTSRWRGALTGIAAGIKLTPLVFLAHLVATGQWRAAGVMTASFAATVLVPVVLIPGDGMGFWTEVLPDAERIGASWYAGNQSLMGVVARVGGDSPWVRPAWFVASVVMVLGALWLARSLHVRSDPLAAVSVTGLASLLASPVSWSHHWVWCIPLGVVALRHVGRPAALLWTACFIASPHRWVPTGRDRELAWTWEHVPGDAYVWLGLLWLGRAAWLTAGATPGRQSGVPPRVASGGRRRRGGTARAVSSVTRSARSEGTRSIPRKRRAVRQGLQGPRAPGGLVLPAADSAAQLRQCDGAVTSGALDPSQ